MSLSLRKQIDVRARPDDLPGLVQRVPPKLAGGAMFAASPGRMETHEVQNRSARLWPEAGSWNRHGAVATMGRTSLRPVITPVAHYLCVLACFASLSAVRFVKFAPTAGQGRWRTRVLSGWVMIASLLLTRVTLPYKNLLEGEVAQPVLEYEPIFRFEAVGSPAFSLSRPVRSKVELVLVRGGSATRTATPGCPQALRPGRSRGSQGRRTCRTDP